MQTYKSAYSLIMSSVYVCVRHANDRPPTSGIAYAKLISVPRSVAVVRLLMVKVILISKFAVNGEQVRD